MKELITRTALRRLCHEVAGAPVNGSSPVIVVEGNQPPHEVPVEWKRGILRQTRVGRDWLIQRAIEEIQSL